MPQYLPASPFQVGLPPQPMHMGTWWASRHAVLQYPPASPCQVGLFPQLTHMGVAIDILSAYLGSRWKGEGGGMSEHAYGAKMLRA